VFFAEHYVGGYAFPYNPIRRGIMADLRVMTTTGEETILKEATVQ
jgi:hypothetical protein